MKLFLFLLALLCMHAIFSQESVHVERSYPQVVFDSDTCCWRKLSADGNDEAAAAMVVDYLRKSPHAHNLHSLRWHAGQLFAFAGNERDAKRYFRKTYSIFYKWFGGEDGRAWYWFVKGNIAFLDRKKGRLDRMLIKWERKLPQDKNYRFIKKLSANWERSYKENGR